MALYIVKPWYKKEEPPIPQSIYGAEWAGTSDPSWVRTDAAVGFADPNPYYSGMSTTPSSPFDNIMPWAGMQRVTDASAGELVEIPKFYYKWTRDGVKMKLQISMSQFDGSHVSPAHADRGDGVGERDYVYVGRYHCSTIDYKSASGVYPKGSITRATARSNIHNLGNNVYLYDFATRWTVNMLYLVEYANWNSQAMIGYGRAIGSGAGSLMRMGYTDTMPYHTGTDRTSRTTYGGTQYRYIEGWWDNVTDWTDGIYISGSNVYAIKNPSNFSDTTGGVNIGVKCTSSGTIKSWTNPQVDGFEYALIPSSVNSTEETYICDYYGYGSSGQVVSMGGDYTYLNLIGGAFCYWADNSTSSTWPQVGARLMVLPPSRLSS